MIGRIFVSVIRCLIVCPHFAVTSTNLITIVNASKTESDTVNNTIEDGISVSFNGNRNEVNSVWQESEETEKSDDQNGHDYDPIKKGNAQNVYNAPKQTNISQDIFKTVGFQHYGRRIGDNGRNGKKRLKRLRRQSRRNYGNRQQNGKSEMFEFMRQFGYFSLQSEGRSSNNPPQVSES